MATLPQFIDDLPDFPEEVIEQEAFQRRRLFTATVDTYLILTVGILVAIGLMMVWSTTFYWSNPQSAMFLQQLRNAGLGIVIMFILAVIDYRLWRRLAIPMMSVTILLLLGLIVLPGVQLVYGARRAYFNGAVQPAEIAVLVVTIYMGAWLTAKQAKLKHLTYGLLPFALLVGTVAGLILLQPDISTAIMVLAVASIMFFLAGAEWTQIGIASLAFIVIGAVSITQFDYARARVENYFEMLRDPLEANDQAQAAIIGFLNGGIGGVGLGESRQKFEQLPTPHTDSIFAVIGEELGLAGCALVVGLYVTLMVRGFRIAKNAPDMFGALLAAGITISIVLEALFNIAVMASVVPFTGVPLPFISFGGSSLVSGLASVGILVSISRATARKSIPTRRVNETLSLPGMRASISRVRQKPTEGE
ncbi:MAG TPA: FtsW/RodA/SpoVE family cell cycle protein [Aggregatilineales bacterium]|nr:FtsW/RodA/SpoVE family cell cycle protein [Anaerolineales bacterium]HRE46140.1 FtsW/RodA/SpoVE family cell cycle protein [Aggregatilineales bacterium]